MELKTTAFIFETGQEIEGSWDYEKNIFIGQDRTEYTRDKVFTLFDKDNLKFKSIEALLKEWNKYSPALSLKNYLNARKRYLELLNDNDERVICPKCGKPRQIWPFNNIYCLSGRGGFYWLCMSCGDIEDECHLRS